jgi:hypothetical protein
MFRPGNPEYKDARQEFNRYSNKFLRVIVFARKTDDVVNAVRLHETDVIGRDIQATSGIPEESGRTILPWF